MTMTELTLLMIVHLLHVCRTGMSLGVGVGLHDLSLSLSGLSLRHM